MVPFTIIKIHDLEEHIFKKEDIEPRHKPRYTICMYL